MHAIEFITKAKDGIIQIPKKYVKNLKDEIRVIILINNEHQTLRMENLKKPMFTALEIDTKELSFDRDEANKR